MKRKRTEKAGKLMALFRKLESEDGRDKAIFYIQALLHGQEALKADCGLLPKSKQEPAA